MQTPQDVIRQWTAKLVTSPDLARNLNARYKFVVTGNGGGTWIFDCTKEQPVVTQQNDGEAECTLSMQSDVFLQVASGKLNPQIAVIMQQIEIQGDMGLAMRLSELM